MPSVISHAVVGAAAGVALAPTEAPFYFLPLAVFCSILPDADILAFAFRIPYSHFFGHRGFFHSFCFALLAGLAVACPFYLRPESRSGDWAFYCLFFFLLTASHGILDGFTNGGLGAALFSPFSAKRYFFPWTPIVVSPVNLKLFFGKEGAIVLKNEILWIWLPALLLAAISRMIRY